MEIDKDIFLKRFKKMDSLLQNLNEIKKKKEENFVSNFLLYLSAQEALETCINICIDIGNHILSLNKNGIPKTYSEIFIELSKLGIIDKSLEEKLINITFSWKEKGLGLWGGGPDDAQQIYDILQENLEDFNEFKKQVFKKFKTQLLNEGK